MQDKRPTKKPRTQKIQQLGEVEHCWRRKEVYLGTSAEPEIRQYACVASDLSRINMESGLCSDAIEKICDEIITNARDHCYRSRSGVKNIWITISSAGVITVHNDGAGIPIKKQKKVWSVELAFAHLRAGDNFNDDDDEERITGGRNGVGSTLTLLYSTQFSVKTRSRNKVYEQEWRFESGSIRREIKSFSGPTIYDVPSTEPFKGTEIVFTPDYSFFGIEPTLPSLLSFIRRRALEIAISTASAVKVWLSEGGPFVPVQIKEKDYAMLYVGRDVKMATISSDRWCAVIAPNMEGIAPISLVNGIPTPKGGTHVQQYSKVWKKIAEKLSTSKEKYTESFVRKNAFLLVNAVINKPSFESQGKFKLTSRARDFGSVPTIKDSDISRAYNVLQAHLKDVYDSKSSRKLTSASKKVNKRDLLKEIPKLDDANNAGKRKNSCTLILTEGDSAKALAIAGLSVVGRDNYGVFPLKGKLLNVRDVTTGTIFQNKEVMNLMKIIGLQAGVKADVTKLRYRHVVVMTDADDDGTHISSLVTNMIASMWPELLCQVPDFLAVFVTPQRRAYRRSEYVDFYSVRQYDDWVEQTTNVSQFTIKFFKGLGSWTRKDAKEFFKEYSRHVKYFDLASETDFKALELAFSKDQSDARKQWLSIPVEPCMDWPSTYEDFINKKLVHFSRASIVRAIPHLGDGLKPSLRKIMYVMLKNREFSPTNVRGVKVAQAAAKVAEQSEYHHGEASLCAAITGLAQDFVGSNNLPLIEPLGQFGTRLLGGKDASAERYIYTRLQPFTRSLFPEHLVLDYKEEENKVVEPVSFMPVVPLVLVNGCNGIATGYSTQVLPHDIHDVIAATEAYLNAQDFDFDIKPHWRRFCGTIQKENASVIKRML